MKFNEQPTYYDVLDLTPDASPQEIREAYLRIKATYSKDSIALYSLIEGQDREEMLKLIQEAYEILSNPEKRREYDKFYGPLDANENLPPVAPASAARNSKKIISIDRVPPMETSGGGEELLVAPTTDFAAQPTAMTSETPPAPPVANAAPSPAQTPVAPAMPASPPPIDQAQATLQQEIDAETEWKGAFLRKVREGKRISLEEMTGITKISKTYILAIEEDNHSKLPAAVFVRGFISQIARTLKLPHEKVVASYMARFGQAQSDKSR